MRRPFRLFCTRALRYLLVACPGQLNCNCAPLKASSTLRVELNRAALVLELRMYLNGNNSRIAALAT
jgi:hypothetical protein